VSIKPRRCGKRWLDGDCPAEVLAIIDDPRYSDRYTVLLTTPTGENEQGTWLSLIALTENGAYYHDELPAHQVAAYRYRQKHRYTRWSDLPVAVRDVVRREVDHA
jgi:hypothetical protein